MTELEDSSIARRFRKQVDRAVDKGIIRGGGDARMILTKEGRPDHKDRCKIEAFGDVVGQGQGWTACSRAINEFKGYINRHD